MPLQNIENLPPDGAESEMRRRTRLWREEPTSLATRILSCLLFMLAQHIDLPLLLWGITHLDELLKNNTATSERRALTESCELPVILEQLNSSAGSSGRDAFESFSFHIVHRQFDKELKDLKPLHSMPAKDLTPGDLLSIKMDEMLPATKTIAPKLFGTLRHICCTRQQERRNKHKSPDPVAFYMICMALGNRSPHQSKMKKLITFYMKSSGLAAKAFDTLSSFGVTLSQKWAYAAVDRISQLAQAEMLEMTRTHLFHCGHDNLNIAFRVQEQRLDNKSHFDSGTSATVYLVQDESIPPPDNRLLQATRTAGSSDPITSTDIINLNIAAAPRLRQLAIHHILQALTTSGAFQFKSYAHKDDPRFVRPSSGSERPSGKENITKQYILETIHQEEASYEGNDRVLNYYLGSLKLDTPDEQQKTGLERVIIWVGDQLTTARLRFLRRHRGQDSNSFLRMDWLIMMFGWFHLMMTFANSLHKQYFGTSTGFGLKHGIELLGRKGLKDPSTKGNFHHNLEEALYHIWYAHLRDIWRTVSGVEHLKNLRKKSVDELYILAEQIFDEYCSTAALVELQNSTETARDHILEHTVMWLRDMLDYVTLKDAISHADVSTMIDMIPRLIFRFVGGKNSNYATELFELLQGLLKEWTEDVKALVKDSWLVNTTGRPDGHIPTDQNQEHNIRDEKDQFAASGANNTWDYLKRMSSAIPTMREIIRHVQYSINPYARYDKHHSPDADKDIERLATAYANSKIHVKKDHRRARDTISDFVEKGSGEEKLESALKRWHENRTRERSTAEEY